jgi:hypothetical protein
MLFYGNSPELLKVAATRVPMQWYSSDYRSVEDHGSYWVDIPQVIDGKEEPTEEYIWRFKNPEYIFRIAP